MIDSIAEIADASADLKRTKRPKDSAEAMQERIIIGSVLQSPGQPLPPTISRVLDFAPDGFNSLEIGSIAAAIRKSRTNGHAPDLVSIGKILSADYVGVLSQLANDASAGLPLALAEIEAGSLIGRMQSKQIESCLGEAWQETREHPERAASIAAHAREALTRLAEDSPKADGLTIRTPDEILAMTFDDSDRLLGDRLLAKGQSLVMAGPGGIGKSRLLLQLAVSTRAGLPFISFETRGQELRWLILQTENSNRRLQDDWLALRDWIGEKHWPRVSEGIRSLPEKGNRHRQVQERGFHTKAISSSSQLQWRQERWQSGTRSLPLQE